MKPNDIVNKAIEFAKIVHAGQIRRTGENFINHPIRVKKSLERIGINDQTTLAAAILHATIKEGGVKLEEIQKEFGSEITFILDRLQKASLIIPLEENRTRINNLHKFIIHMSKDIRVLLIRLADRLDNIKTAHALPKDDQKWLALKALQIYAPMAKAVGVYYFTRKLEKEALKILDPKRYKVIDEFLNEKFTDAEKDLKKAEKKMKRILETKNEKFEVSFRRKSLYSTHTKAINKYNKGEISSPESFGELFDLLGMRILVQKESTCYEVLAFIQENWPVIQEEFDDYIAKPKANGYKTLQTAIQLTQDHTCEVQIRTFDMHHHNEYGPASHFAYKYGSEGSNQKQSSWIKELINQKNQINESIAGNTKIRLFEETVFVFTPKGKLITLTAGSTPVDFAYAVHTDIGNHCCGAKIDGKIVGLDTPLTSGNTVEILLNRNHKPSLDWLKFVKTSEAKRQIRKIVT